MNVLKNIVAIFMLVVIGVLTISILSSAKTIHPADYDTRSNTYMERILAAADADGVVSTLDFDAETISEILGHDTSKQLSIKINITNMNVTEEIYSVYFSEEHYKLIYPIIRIKENKYRDIYRYAIRDFADVEKTGMIEFHFIYDLNR